MTTIIFETSSAPDGSLVFDTPAIPDPAPVVRTVTDDLFAAWLKSDAAIANILVETWALVDGVRTRFTWSTNGYTTAGTNNPVFYAPVISASLPYTEELPLNSAASLSAGDFEIDNTNGVNEAFAGYIWADEIAAYVGDQTWSRVDYREIYVGHTAGLVRKGRGAFALRLRDMMAGLDYPMSERKFGGNGPNANLSIPLTFGEACNASGEWNDATALKRQWHDGPIEGIPETRANALPITDEVTVSDSTGTATLSINNGSAVITATVQGDKFGGVFRKTIATLVQRFITGYGKYADRYSLANIDAVNFAAFDAANQQPVGMHFREIPNVIDACAMLASSVGAQLAPTLLGKLQLIQIALPAAGPATEIRAEQMVGGTLKHVQHIEPVAAVELGYCKNWTPQPGLSSNVLAEHLALFEKEWPLTVLRTRPDVMRDYKLPGTATMRPTMLLLPEDAEAEADRLNALWGPGRDIYEFEGAPDLLLLAIGARLVVYHEVDGMIAGVEAQVLSIKRDWWTRKVTIRFLK